MNYFANIVVMMIVINFIILIIQLVKTHYNYILPVKADRITQFDKDQYEKVHKGFLGMFSGFKPEFKYAAYLTSFLVLKDMLIPAGLVFGVSSPFIQLSPMILFQIVTIPVLIYFKPYENKGENFLAIYNSILYFFGILVFLLLAILKNVLSEKQKYLFLGFPLIGILMLIIIANIGYGIVDSILSIIKLCKKVLRQKKIPNKIKVFEGDKKKMENDKSPDKNIK